MPTASCNVSAREQRSGKEAEIQVQPSYGLTDEQVEGMILDSFDNAEEDFRRRQVIEARNEAATIFAALEKGKKSAAWGHLTTDEKKQIAKMEKSLAAVKTEDDYPGDPQSDRCAEPGHDAPGRTDDGHGRDVGAERQEHGRDGPGRRPHRPASHGESRI